MKKGLCLATYWRSGGRGKGKVGTREGAGLVPQQRPAQGPPLARPEEMPEDARLCTPQHSSVTRIILVTRPQA